MKLQLLFNGGIGGNIGGNALVLKVNDSFNYLFDFGVVPSRYKSAKSFGLEPTNLEEFVRRKLVSPIDFRIRACFITHAHPDHYLALPALFASKYRPNAVWASRTTSRIVDGAVDFVERTLTCDPMGSGNYYVDPELERLGEDFKIVPFPVDHDIPGACAYFMLTQRSLVIYTGDFCDHGLLSTIIPSQFWRYAQQIAGGRQKILVTEGTNFGLPFTHRSDLDFQLRLGEIFATYCNEFLMISLGTTAVWDFLAAVKEIVKLPLQRKVVISRNLAKSLASLRESFLADYQRVISPDDFYAFRSALDPTKYEVLDFSRNLGIELCRDIAVNPSSYILFATKTEAIKISDLVCSYRGQGGGCVVLGFSEGEEEAENVSKDFAKAAADLGLSVERTNAPARGHVSPHRLAEIVKSLEPHQILVMHTLSPTGLKSFLESHTNSNVAVPSFGNIVDLE